MCDRVYDKVEVIEDLMKGVSKKHIQNVKKIISESKEENTFHFIYMRFLDAYEKIYDALESGDKEIKINNRIYLNLKYSIVDLSITVKCIYNNHTFTKKIKGDFHSLHKTTLKILSFVLDNDKEFFNIHK